MNPVRILHLRASNFVGGPERQILRYAGYERTPEIEVIIGSFVGPSEGTQFLQEASRQQVRTLALQNGGLFRMAKELANFVRREQIALICTHGYKATIVSYLARLREPVGLAPFLRGWTGEDRKVKTFEAFERMLLGRCDRVVCLSQNQVTRLGASSSWEKRARVVVNVGEAQPVSPERSAAARRKLKERYGVPDSAVVLASAGRLSPEKGTRDFITAAHQLAGKHSPAYFLIFGEGKLRAELEAFAASRSERIKFAGFAPDFPELLPGIDILVNPSLAEEMPNVVLEALASAVPVVATAVGGVPELAGSPPAFPLVPAGMPAELASAIEPLLTSADRRREIGLAGQARLASALSPATQEKQLRAVYREFAPWIAGEEVESPRLPKITVVMPVRNEEHSIGIGLDALLAQDYPAEKLEIIVADGNSTDRTAEVVNERAKKARAAIRLLPNPGQLSSAGRNVGAKAATGEIVAYIDGHCYIPGTNLLRDFARWLEGPAVDALCRPQPLNFPGNNEFQRMVASVRETALGHGRDSTIYSLNNSGLVDPTSSGAIYRKSVFEKIGYYDESFDACEDVEFNHRVHAAGLKAFIDPSLTIFYQPRANFRALFRQLQRYGKGRFRLIRKHPGAFSIAQLVPPGLLMYAVFAAIAMGFLPPGLRLGVAAPLLLYLAMVLLFSASLMPRHGWKVLVYGPLLYFTVHGGLGWGFLNGVMEALRGKAPRRAETAARGRSAG